MLYVSDESKELSKQVLDLQVKNTELSEKLLSAESASTTHLLGSIKLLGENATLTDENATLTRRLYDLGEKE